MLCQIYHVKLYSHRHISRSPMVDIQKAVREKYSALATRSGSCAPGEACCGTDPITADLCSTTEAEGIPADALAASLGCGNPTALLHLQPGQTVLDLGCGGGIDV